MDKLAFYGKGGIGKSTVSTNVSALLALGGRRVLHVGCDPKHDSTLPFLDGAPVVTVLDTLFRVPSGGLTREHFIMPGRLGIDCIESGGPEPGVGCGGRGVSRMFELLDELGVLSGERYDAAVFDVLGDVVCGGFAAPLRRGFARKVVIVSSEEVMSLYAANNICKAIHHYRANGVALVGLVFNLRDNRTDREALHDFAERIGTAVLCILPRERQVRRAEVTGRTLVEQAPRSRMARELKALSERILAADPDACPPPRPMDNDSFHKYVRSLE
ncbi:MAG: AAA family ATPase [Polyangia bacterium]|jgi:nitrogenase iron protein|nr:AAA family ATPase [Polyangia bacterium]